MIRVEARLTFVGVVVDVVGRVEDAAAGKDVIDPSAIAGLRGERFL